MQIADKIKMIRKSKSQTQQEVANALNTAREQYWKYENGKQEIPAYRIKELCIFWEISANYLLDIPEYPRPNT